MFPDNVDILLGHLSVVLFSIQKVSDLKLDAQLFLIVYPAGMGL